MAAAIDYQVTDLQAIIAAVFLGALPPAQQRLNAVLELPWTERFGQVIVGAGLEARDFVIEHVMRGEKQRGRVDTAISQFLQQLDPGHFRHGHIQDEAIEAIRGNGLQRHRGALLFGDVKSQTAKIFREQRTHFDVVIYNHQLLGRCDGRFGIHSSFPCVLRPINGGGPVQARQM
jgi:hypothetical protein